MVNGVVDAKAVMNYFPNRYIEGDEWFDVVFKLVEVFNNTDVTQRKIVNL